MVAGGSSDIYRTEHFYGKSNRPDGRRVILVITDTPDKQREVRELLQDQYGCVVVCLAPDANVHAATLAAATTPEACQSPACASSIRGLMQHWDDISRGEAASPQFVMRETCVLRDLRTKQSLSHAEAIAHPERMPPYVTNSSFLAVFALCWDKETGKLGDIDARWFTHEQQGRFDPARAASRRHDTFGWDHLFVVPQMGMSIQEMKDRGGVKLASRQMTLDSFVCKFLIYARPKTLGYTEHFPTEHTRGVDFRHEVSVQTFLASNPWTNNKHLADWRINRYLTHILNKGVFFKAATSRPLGNFFSPPLGGVPLTHKKDAQESTVFLVHDIHHQGIAPDLVYEGTDLAQLTPADRRAYINTYCAVRMMSESCTLMLADCLYASTLAATDAKDERCLDKRIWPLFKAIRRKACDFSGGAAAGGGAASAAPPGETVAGGGAASVAAVGPTVLQSEGGLEQIVPARDNVLPTIKRLLWANTAFALVGDQSEFAALLESPEENQAQLDAYVAHFTKFFVGDHIWTRNNLDHFVSHSASYRVWIDLVGHERIAAANLMRLSEMVAKLKARGAPITGTFDKNMVRHVFDCVFETYIKEPYGSDEPIVALSAQQRLCNAFRRWAIGQTFFYAKYSFILPDLLRRAREWWAAIDAAGADFDAATLARLREHFEADVAFVWGIGVISTSAATMTRDVHPLFQPSYIVYADLGFKTVPETLRVIHPPPRRAEFFMPLTNE